MGAVSELVEAYEFTGLLGGVSADLEAWGRTGPDASGPDEPPASSGRLACGGWKGLPMIPSLRSGLKPPIASE